jgi:purine-binding chemotaxis protein CheW
VPTVDPAQGQDKVICFQLRGQEFALPITGVKETIAARPLTRLPHCPPCVAGLINLRGDVVAVLDLARLLDLPHAPLPAPPEGRRIILLRGAGPRALCGLLCDALSAAQRLPEGAVRPLPDALPETPRAYLRGMARLEEEPAPGGALGERAGRLLLLLDLDRVLAAEPLRPFRRHPEGSG